MSLQDVSCNNHKAIDVSLVAHAGLAETGMGSVSCSRHSMHMPEGSVSFLKGEQCVFAAGRCAVADDLGNPGMRSLIMPSEVS